MVSLGGIRFSRKDKKKKKEAEEETRTSVPPPAQQSMVAPAPAPAPATVEPRPQTPKSWLERLREKEHPLYKGVVTPGRYQNTWTVSYKGKVWTQRGDVETYCHRFAHPSRPGVEIRLQPTAHEKHMSSGTDCFTSTDCLFVDTVVQAGTSWNTFALVDIPGWPKDKKGKMSLEAYNAEDWVAVVISAGGKSVSRKKITVSAGSGELFNMTLRGADWVRRHKAR